MLHSLTYGERKSFGAQSIGQILIFLCGRDLSTKGLFIGTMILKPSRKMFREFWRLLIRMTRTWEDFNAYQNCSAHMTRGSSRSRKTAITSNRIQQGSL